MSTIDALAANFRRLDRLALAETVIHRLDARAKLIATLAFVVAVASFDRYAVAALLPFAVFPIVLAALGELPAAYLAKNVALALPFALLIGLCNPFFDRQTLLHLGALSISGGWVSCASIVLRALLTCSAALILVAVTGFPALCSALERLGLPKAFALQMQFLHRYIFVLLDDASRSARALALRSAGRPLRLANVAPLFGPMLLRTWQRAEQIHRAMLSRGFTGEFHARRSARFARRDACFVVGWIACFALLRSCDVAPWLGALALQVLA